MHDRTGFGTYPEINRWTEPLIKGATMELNLAAVAGSISTTIFVASTFPMLLKAFRTKDLSSYSPGNLLLANLGNVVHSIYVYQLPPGPIWLLHTFHLVPTAMMLALYARSEWLKPLRRERA